jgi:hypothetical protein
VLLTRIVVVLRPGFAVTLYIIEAIHDNAVSFSLSPVFLDMSPWFYFLWMKVSELIGYRIGLDFFKS